MAIAVKKKEAENPVAKEIAKPTPTTTVTGTAVVQHPDGSETETKEDLPVKAVVSEHPVMVGVNVGITRNLGNYESIKASVTITIPCPLDADEIEATYEQAKNWVDSKINDINEEINKNLQ